MSQQRFQSPQACYHKQHARIIGVPQQEFNPNNHQFPPAIHPVPMPYGYPPPPPQSSSKQIVPYPFTPENLDASRFSDPDHGHQEQDPVKKPSYSNIRSKARRELSSIEKIYSLENARDLYWKPITNFCLLTKQHD